MSPECPQHPALPRPILKLGRIPAFSLSLFCLFLNQFFPDGLLQRSDGHSPGSARMLRVSAEKSPTRPRAELRQCGGDQTVVNSGQDYSIPDDFTELVTCCPFTTSLPSRAGGGTDPWSPGFSPTEELTGTQQPSPPSPPPPPPCSSKAA